MSSRLLLLDDQFDKPPTRFKDRCTPGAAHRTQDARVANDHMASDNFRFRVTVLPPATSSRRAGQKIGSPSKPLASFIIPCNPQQTFLEVWECTKDKFVRCYEHLAGTGWFHKLQTVDGFDVPLEDKVGALGYGPHSTPQELHLYVLQNPLDRAGSLAATSALRPPGYKRPLLSAEQQQRVKRQRLEHERYGSRIEDLTQDQAVTSREDTRNGDDWPEDDEGFKIPMRRNNSSRRPSHHSLVQDSQSEGTSHMRRSQSVRAIDQDSQPEEHVQDYQHSQPDHQEDYIVQDSQSEEQDSRSEQPISRHQREHTNTPLREALQTIKRANRHDTAKSVAPPTPVSEEVASSSAAPDSAQRQRPSPPASVYNQPDIFDIASTAEAESVVTDNTPQQSSKRGVSSASKNVFNVLKSSAQSTTPTSWSAKETTLLISCFENGANATAIAEELLNKLKTVRSASAIRGQKKLLMSRGLLSASDDVPSSSGQTANSSPANLLPSDDIVDSSPIERRTSAPPRVTKRKAASRSAVNVNTRAATTSRLSRASTQTGASSSELTLLKAPKQTTLNFSQQPPDDSEHLGETYSGKGKGRAIDVGRAEGSEQAPITGAAGSEHAPITITGDDPLEVIDPLNDATASDKAGEQAVEQLLAERSSSEANVRSRRLNLEQASSINESAPTNGHETGTNGALDKDDAESYLPAPNPAALSLDVTATPQSSGSLLLDDISSADQELLDMHEGIITLPNPADLSQPSDEEVSEYHESQESVVHNDVPISYPSLDEQVEAGASTEAVQSPLLLEDPETDVQRTPVRNAVHIATNNNTSLSSTPGPGHMKTPAAFNVMATPASNQDQASRSIIDGSKSTLRHHRGRRNRRGSHMSLESRSSSLLHERINFDPSTGIVARQFDQEQTYWSPGSPFRKASRSSGDPSIAKQVPISESESGLSYQTSEASRQAENDVEARTEARNDGEAHIEAENDDEAHTEVENNAKTHTESKQPTLQAVESTRQETAPAQQPSQRSGSLWSTMGKLTAFNKIDIPFIRTSRGVTAETTAAAAGTTTTKSTMLDVDDDDDDNDNSE